MKDKDKYIPHPSVKEEVIAEGTYNEYREQATEPKHIGEVIEEMEHDPDSIMGILQSIKKSAITMVDEVDEETGEWNC